MRFEESPDIIYGETAHLYDHLPRYTNRVDRDFYVSEALASGGPVLELGCGTGRVLFPIARAGVPIIGLDLAAPMLAILKQKLATEPTEVQDRVQLVLGTMLDFHIEGCFPLITTPFRSFQHLLTQEDQATCLEHVKLHLTPGGRFILDIFQPDEEIINGPVGTPVEDVHPVALPNGGTLRRITRVMAACPKTQVADIQMAYEVTAPDGVITRYIQAFKWRYFFRPEVEALLESHGFRILDLYGNYDRSPHSDASPEMVFVTERA
jgi:SAM-dependent methyltransferase